MSAPLRMLVIVTALLAFVLQATSVALFGPLAHRPSLPSAAASTWPFDVAAASGLDRLAPVRVELARAALVHGEPDRAAGYLAGLPPSALVADLDGQVALAHAQGDAAVAAFSRAGDVMRAGAAIDVVAQTNTLGAYALARTFYDENVRRGAPLAVQGQAASHAGTLAATAAYEHPADAQTYNQQAVVLARAAVAADPLQVAYQLSLGVASLKVGDAAAARDAYRAAARLAPQSFDAAAGLAIAAAAAGDCPAARRAEARAQQLGQQQDRRLDAAFQGYTAPQKTALQRCVNG